MESDVLQKEENQQKPDTHQGDDLLHACLVSARTAVVFGPSMAISPMPHVVPSPLATYTNVGSAGAPSKGGFEPKRTRCVFQGVWFVEKVRRKCTFCITLDDL